MLKQEHKKTKQRGLLSQQQINGIIKIFNKKRKRKVKKEQQNTGEIENKQQDFKLNPTESMIKYQPNILTFNKKSEILN